MFGKDIKIRIMKISWKVNFWLKIKSDLKIVLLNYNLLKKHKKLIYFQTYFKNNKNDIN